MDYAKVCFVIMPFGKKPVGDHQVDFDTLYDDISCRRSARCLARGRQARAAAHRQGLLHQRHQAGEFEYLEYSRFALADISGLNFNVAYELGVRHRARESGTAIFRQRNSRRPSNRSIKAFPYEYSRPIWSPRRAR